MSSSKLYLCLMVTSLYIVHGKICEKRRLITKSNGDIETQIQQFCCPNYLNVETEDNKNSTLNCQPICRPACVKGDCVSPNVCVCRPGHKKSDQPHICKPSCSDPCDNGICIEPEVCQCNHGYNFNLDKGVCEPVCTEPCVNGICMSPENCQCNPGYRKTESNVCEPYCSAGCDHGTCIAPEICLCEDGWSIVPPFGICGPVCIEPCTNGICVAPETCECYPGYTKSDYDICEWYPDYTTEESSEREMTSTDVLETIEDDEAFDTTEKLGANETSSWLLYVVAAIVLVILLTVKVIVIAKRKFLYEYCIGHSYTPADNNYPMKQAGV